MVWLAIPAPEPRPGQHTVANPNTTRGLNPARRLPHLFANPAPSERFGLLHIRRLPFRSILQIRRPCNAWYDIRHDHLWGTTSIAGTESRSSSRMTYLRR